MFSSRRNPSSSTLSIFSSFSSDNPYIPNSRRAPPVALRPLVVHDLEDSYSSDWDRSLSRQREPFRIPRPNLTVPRPSIHMSINEEVWTTDRGQTYVEEYPPSPDLNSRTYLSQRPFHQIVSPPPSPIPPPRPIQYQIVPLSLHRRSPTHIFRRIQRKKYLQERSPGFCTTLFSGGFGTVAALLYLCCALALPITKLVLGIIHLEECPVNKNIPIYMIVSGACGLGLILFLLLSSSCRFYRSSIIARKSTHQFMIYTIAFARGMQGAIAIFLFIWFFVGNFWVFGARYRVLTDRPNDIDNYCQPALYWFAFYVLIFTYVYAVFMCFAKFCTNFFCCGAYDMWKRAFS